MAWDPNAANTQIDNLQKQVNGIINAGVKDKESIITEQQLNEIDTSIAVMLSDPHFQLYHDDLSTMVGDTQKLRDSLGKFHPLDGSILSDLSSKIKRIVPFATPQQAKEKEGDVKAQKQKHEELLKSLLQHPNFEPETTIPRFKHAGYQAPEVKKYFDKFFYTPKYVIHEAPFMSMTGTYVISVWDPQTNKISRHNILLSADTKLKGIQLIPDLSPRVPPIPFDSVQKLLEYLKLEQPSSATTAAATSSNTASTDTAAVISAEVSKSDKEAAATSTAVPDLKNAIKNGNIDTSKLNYHPKVDKKGAETLLKNNGEYLFRDSSIPGRTVLSYKFNDKINHMLIGVTKEGLIYWDNNPATPPKPTPLDNKRPLALYLRNFEEFCKAIGATIPVRPAKQ